MLNFQASPPFRPPDLRRTTRRPVRAGVRASAHVQGREYPGTRAGNACRSSHEAHAGEPTRQSTGPGGQAVAPRVGAPSLMMSMTWSSPMRFNTRRTAGVGERTTSRLRRDAARLCACVIARAPVESMKVRPLRSSQNSPPCPSSAHRRPQPIRGRSRRPIPRSRTACAWTVPVEIGRQQVLSHGASPPCPAHIRITASARPQSTRRCGPACSTNPQVIARRDSGKESAPMQFEMAGWCPDA